MQLAWASDIHLNSVKSLELRRRFYQSASESGDGLLITGDLSKGRDLEEKLRELEFFVGKPVYFVLGNHDFYGRAIAETRREVTEICRASKRLVYLSEANIVRLSSNTALVGHDGWADGQMGDIENAASTFGDYLSIHDLRQWMNEHWGLTLKHLKLRQKVHDLGAEAAAHLASLLTEAAETFEQVIVATHIPPFREVAWYMGQPCDENRLPYFACKAVGDLLLRSVRAFPRCKFLVLAGHTHHPAEEVLRQNLSAFVARAEYGEPRIERVFSV